MKPDTLALLQAALAEDKPKPPPGFLPASHFCQEWNLGRERTSELLRKAISKGLAERVRIGSAYFYKLNLDKKKAPGSRGLV